MSPTGGGPRYEMGERWPTQARARAPFNEARVGEGADFATSPTPMVRDLHTPIVKPASFAADSAGVTVIEQPPSPIYILK
jgi:hypothetical protein